MEADSYWGQIANPLEYRVSRPWKAAFLAIGGCFAYGTVFFLSGASFHRAPIASLFMAGVDAFLSLYFLLYVFRGLIRITAERVDCQYAFSSNSMRRAEVVGKKMCHTQRSGRVFYRLVSKADRLMLIDGGAFGVDRRFNIWLESLPTIEGLA